MNRVEFENIAKSIRQRAADVVWACVANHDEAEDVAQDVILRLWTLHDDIKSKAHATNLAVRMARNIVIDNSRKSRTIPLDASRQMIDESNAQPDISLEEDEDMAWLMDKMRHLPPKEYQILRLRQVELKSNDDIANLLGIEKSSVATLLSRARTKLFNELKARIK